MSGKRKGLGRGLDALLGGKPQEGKALGAAAQSGADSAAGESSSPPPGMAFLEHDHLEPNRFQPRSRFDDSGLDELAESIRAQGIVQPIVVTPKGEGRYTIIAGERRWRASRRAGLKRVPVVIREVTDDLQLLELALVENVQRADLNSVEEAEAYRTLGDSFGLSQEEIAKRVGKARTTITNTLRLLRLPEEIQDFLREGTLTPGQARPLLALPTREKQIELAQRAVEEGLTARELEALAKEPAKKAESKPKPEEPDVHTRAAMERLTQSLQTKVEIVRRRRGGVLRLHFHSEEELIRLYDRLIEGIR